MDYLIHKIHISPLYPPLAVLGRSIVIHDHLDGSYLTCANIEPAILSGTPVDINFPRNGVDATDLNFRLVCSLFPHPTASIQNVHDTCGVL